MNRVELPTTSGAYRWYYADFTSGPYTAVFIFMVGSVFSARYSASLRKGGRPREHAAVNFALYERGARWQWVLTEYQDVSIEESGRLLRIGRSTLRYDEHSVTFHVVDRTTPFLATNWGSVTEARLVLRPRCPPGPELKIVDGLEHRWQVYAAMADGELSLPRHDLKLEGQGYHDGNHGPVPLGSDLSGWEWARTHAEHGTTIDYRPWSGDTHWRIEARREGVTVERQDSRPPPHLRSSWGLRLPETLDGVRQPSLLESSPFYARLESSGPGGHSLGEVADFRRFHSPSLRWMARFKTRLQEADEGTL